MVGIILAAVSVLSMGIGARLQVPVDIGYRLSEVQPHPGLLLLLLFACVPFLSLVVSLALARLVFRAGGSLAADLFVASACMLPLGVVALVSGMLGNLNAEVILILSVFMLTLAVLLLFSGCTRIHRFSDRTAAWAVPSVIVVAAWITKIVFAAMAR